MARFDPDKWSVGARSETGYVRDENQDRMDWIRAPFGDVYIVSDGMGGVGGGALAATLTVQAFHAHLNRVRVALTIRAAIRNAFEAANEAVYRRGQMQDPETAGMGSTAVALVATGSRIMVAHVGDSRAYLFDRSGQLSRLTKDHSPVQRMIDAGMLTAAEAQKHPDANIIDRAIGHTAQIDVEIGSWMRLRGGDRVMLCSDGLCGYAEDSEIADVLREYVDPQKAADRLVDLALEKGGEDNITVQVIRYAGDATNARQPRPASYALVALVMFLIFGTTIIGTHKYLTGQAGEDVTDLQQRVVALEVQISQHKIKLSQSQALLNSRIAELAAQIRDLERKVNVRVSNSEALSDNGEKEGKSKQSKPSLVKSAAVKSDRTMGSGGDTNNAAENPAKSAPVNKAKSAPDKSSSRSRESRDAAPASAGSSIGSAGHATETREKFGGNPDAQLEHPD